jgi:hypothetical protein
MFQFTTPIFNGYLPKLFSRQLKAFSTSPRTADKIQLLALPNPREQHSTDNFQRSFLPIQQTKSTEVTFSNLVAQLWHSQ